MKQITRVTYDCQGFEIKKFEILNMKDGIIEFENSTEGEIFLDGLLESKLDSVSSVQTENGEGLCLLTLNDSEENAKQMIANDYKSRVTSAENDLKEMKSAYSVLISKI